MMRVDYNNTTFAIHRAPMLRRSLRVQCVAAPDKQGRHCTLCIQPSPPPPPATTTVQRNPNIAKLQAGYLFPEVRCFHSMVHSVTVSTQIARRRREHQEKHPDAKIISLGIGDTTEPIPDVISSAMRDAAIGLGTRTGYSGYVITH